MSLNKFLNLMCLKLKYLQIVFFQRIERFEFGFWCRLRSSKLQQAFVLHELQADVLGSYATTFLKSSEGEFLMKLFLNRFNNCFLLFHLSLAIGYCAQLLRCERVLSILHLTMPIHHLRAKRHCTLIFHIGPRLHNVNATDLSHLTDWVPTLQ